MTKPRQSLSFDAAISAVAGRLGGMAGVAEIAGCSQSLARKWGDPECRERIPLDTAIELDIAYLAAGGDSAPLHASYTTQLELAFASRFADNLALGRLLPEVMRESAEAEVAMVQLMLPGATMNDRRLTLEEVDQAIMAWQRTRVVLAKQIDPSPPSTAPP